MRIQCIAMVARYVVVLHLGVDTMYHANHWKGCNCWLH